MINSLPNLLPNTMSLRELESNYEQNMQFTSIARAKIRDKGRVETAMELFRFKDLTHNCYVICFG